MRQYVHHLVVALWLLFIPFQLTAATPQEIAEQQARQLEQQDQLRREAQQQQRDQQRLQSQGLDTDSLQQPIEDILSDPEQCVEISQINLKGITVFSDSQQAAFVEPYLNQCLGLQSINKLLAEITNRYIKKGFVTSRAYIPPQDLKDGTLELVIIEGEISNYKTDPKRLNELAMSLGFPSRSDNLLNMRDLEQGVDQVNRLQSYKAKTELKPGDKAGQTNVDVKAERTPPWRTVFTYDNSGQPNTGERQLGVLASIDNPISLLDFFSFNYQQDVNSAPPNSGTKNYTAHYDLAFGYWNVDLDASLLQYQSQVEGAATVFTTSGLTRSQSARLSRLLFRNQTTKLGWRATAKRKDSQNFIEDTLIATSSRVLSSASLETYIDQKIKGGSWSITLGYDRGVDWFGAQSDDNQQAGEPEAEFDKFRLRASYSKQFPLFGLNTAYSANLSAQQSSDILFGGEQTSIGGQYTVRGYKGVSLSANTGGNLRQELKFDLPKTNLKWFDYIGSWKLGVGIDAGAVREQRPDEGEYSALYGWGVSLSTSGKPLTLSANYSRPINNPDYLTADPWQVYFSLSYKYDQGFGLWKAPTAAPAAPAKPPEPKQVVAQAKPEPVLASEETKQLTLKQAILDNLDTWPAHWMLVQLSSYRTASNAQADVNRNAEIADFYRPICAGKKGYAVFAGPFESDITAQARINLANKQGYVGSYIRSIPEFKRTQQNCAK